MHCGVFNGLAGLCPPDATSTTPLAMKTENVSRHGPTFLGYSCPVENPQIKGRGGVKVYLTSRSESFRMFTRLLSVFTGSWGAGVT